MQKTATRTITWIDEELMQSALISIRPACSGVAIGLMLAILIALLSFQSAGIVRGGDDEGSGFGGTGRATTPGGSGFGGTGLKPFLGMSSANEVIMIRPGIKVADMTPLRKPSMTGLVAMISSPAEPVQSRIRLTLASTVFRTTDSSPLNITEAIQTDFDINTLLYAHYPPVNEVTVNTVNNAGRVDEQLAANMQAVLPVDSNKRLARPDRIQRPQLPPIQRIRPIQRPSVLPPRIRPMRL